MRIALLDANPAWGGGEQWFLDAACALADRGHTVRVVAKAGSPFADRIQAKASDIAGTGGARAEAGSLAVFPTERMADALAAPAPDVALTNSRRELRAALRVLARGTTVRLVLRRGIDRPLRDHLLRRSAWQRLSAILVNSDATGRTVRRSLPWFPEERIRRLYNAVSLPTGARTGLSGAKRVVARAPLRLGAVARLVRQKGIAVLLDAVAMLDDLPWSLVIAGDGKLRARLEAQARRRGLGDRVQFAGHVDDLAVFYAGLDALVVPSLYEGFGFVAVEGALAGLPVIASDTSSLPEIVDAGRTGLLVAPGDPVAIAQAIRRLAADPVAAAAMGERGRTQALERFAPAQIHDELESFLEWAARLSPVRD